MTLEDRAREALIRAGVVAAQTETNFRDAITGLNSAIDLAHIARTMPKAVTSLVTARASLGETGEEYVELEIRQWERTYHRGNWTSIFPLSDLHQRPQPPAPAPAPAPSRDAAAEALTAAGIRLAQAEAALDGALGRLDDALEFAVHAGIGEDEVDGLVNPGDHLGPVCSQSLKHAISMWDRDDENVAYASAEVPPKVWDLHLLALAAKAEGGYPAAAAIWETALTQLPDGHSWHPRIDQTITSLRAVTRPGDIVTSDGRLLSSQASVHPPAPTLTDAVRDYAIRTRDTLVAWQAIAGWDDATIKSVIGDAPDLDAAFSALAPFVEACAGQSLAGRAFPGPPGPSAPAAGKASRGAMAARNRATQRPGRGVR